jgi:uncharacterized protein (DUF1684 family)
VLAAALALLLMTRTSAPTEKGPDYQREIETWRAQRMARLAAEDGWLTVVGLTWLKDGVNRFGADAASDVVLPAGAPPRAGVLRLAAGHVTVEVQPGANATVGGQPVTSRALRSDADSAGPDILALGAVTLQIIDRGGRLAARVKDRDAAARRAFHGTPWYPVKPEYRVVARFVPHPQPRTLAVATVVGIPEAMSSPGSALFELGGKSLRLDPVLEPGSPQLFFIFRDGTSGKTTYGAARFLYADPPKDGRVVLDFNKAYSPPCAFTPYATCPLPPPQNRLPVAIEAGERQPAP